MKQILGLFLIFTAINITCWGLFGVDLTVKDQITGGIATEVVVIMIAVGSYLLCAGD